MSGRDLTRSMDELFPQQEPDLCRVCNREVVDGRWNYCSERCRDVANAVQRMYIWDEVREAVLERDDYTCASCGLTKEMWWRAYWQMQELTYDYVGDEGARLDREHQIESPSSGGFHVDHVERIADGGHPFDETNLQTLCKYCHRQKTAEENSGRGGPEPDVTLEDYIDA